MAEERVSTQTTTNTAEASSSDDASAQREDDRPPLPLPYAPELFPPPPPARPTTNTGRLVSSPPPSDARRVVPSGMSLPPASPVSPASPPALPAAGRPPAPVTRQVPALIEVPDEAEEPDQPSALFKAVGVSGIYPKVPTERWVEEEDFWLKRTHIASTGRQVVPRPETHALRPPQRFRPIERWKSTLILAVVLGFVALACIGAILFGIYGAHLLQSGQSTPASVTPTIQSSVPAQK